MAKHKLISFCIETLDKLTINITLLKEASHYKVRTEYFKDDDKMKETNNEVERNFVYQIFCNLEAANFEELNDIEDNQLGCLRVYYGSHDYLERHLDKEFISGCKELKNVINNLLEYVDNSIDKSYFC